MKFNTWLEFANYLLENDLDISDVIVECSNPKESSECISESDNEMNNSTKSIVESVKILSLGDEPTIAHEISDVSMNELHVSNLDIIKESCGAGNIQLNESTIYLSICDMQGQTTTNMSISVNGQRFSNLPLSLIESADEKIVLSESWVKENLK